MYATVPNPSPLVTAAVGARGAHLERRVDVGRGSPPASARASGAAAIATLEGASWTW